MYIVYVVYTPKKKEYVLCISSYSNGTPFSKKCLSKVFKNFKGLRVAADYIYDDKLISI